MRKAAMTVAAALAALAAPLSAADDCAPKEKWVEVCETIQVSVPTVEYVEEPCEVTVTRMVPCERKVEVNVGKWVYEEVEVPCTKKVTECEEYTAMVTRYEFRPETRIRKVSKIECVEEERTVVTRVPEEYCDPATGRMTKIWREECRTVTVPVRRKIWVDQEYTINVKCPIQEPVVRTRKVVREIPSTKKVRRRKYVCEVQTRTVTVMEPRVETTTVMRKRAVRTCKTVEKQVVKRIKVPAGPECPSPPICPPAA
ncbi:MAG: hypothetical protein LBE84_07310 [Planctomycetota bacterium]|jgi:hypothetical protein|nr:hypothetical protein [Planctomycetota bacterium]